MIRQAMVHQQDGVDFIQRLPNQSGALLMGVGSGKTLTAIRAAKTPCLIVCRRDDFLTWKTELRSELKPKPFEIDSGDKKWPRKVPSYTLITYDLCKNEIVESWLKHIPFKSMICDEMHLIKRRDSERTKKVLRVADRIPQHIGTTGSAITNKTYEDLFTQMLFADFGRTFGTNYWAFMHEWFIYDKQFGGFHPRANSKERMKKALAKSCFYVDTEDVIDLPPQRFVKKAVPMTGVQRRLTEEVIQFWELHTSTGDIHEINFVTTQLLKLKQIASGFFYAQREDEPRETHRVRNHKIAAVERVLLETLESQPKMVLWGSFDAELEMLQEMCDSQNIPSILYASKLPKKVKESLRKQYLRDKTPVFICNVDAGVGMNELVCANTAGYFSNSHKVVSRTQSLGRTRRKGSEIHREIVVYDFITEGSVDWKILQSITKLQSLAQEILSSLKKGKSIRSLLTAA